MLRKEEVLGLKSRQVELSRHIHIIHSLIPMYEGKEREALEDAYHLLREKARLISEVIFWEGGGMDEIVKVMVKMMKNENRERLRKQELLTMSVEKIEGSVGANGKAILGWLKAIQGRNGIELSPTKGGLHVCLKMDGQLIPLIQVWGKADNRKISEMIETRKQYLPKGLNLTRGEEISIAELFESAGFKKTSGEHLNMRLSYGEDRNPHLRIGPEHLDGMEKALLGTIEIIQRAQPSLR